MPLDAVPWAVAGGAKHSVNSARLLAYAAFGGEEGIIGPADFEVKPLVTPGAAVRVMPGAAAVLNRANNATYEAYATRLPAAEQVSITPTGGTGRTDLVVVRIEDPFEDPGRWTAPSQQAIENSTAQFAFIRVLPNVNPTGNPSGIINGYGYSAIPLAFVTLPANTATVTTARITDARVMPLTRRVSDQTIHTMSNATPRRLTSATEVDWPSEVSRTYDIPRWATHVQVVCTLGGVKYGATGNNGGAGWNTVGQLRPWVGTLAGDATGYNASVDSGQDRVTLLAATQAIPIPIPMRGTSVTVRLRGTRSTGTTALEADGGTTVVMQVAFIQRPESTA